MYVLWGILLQTACDTGLKKQTNLDRLFINYLPSEERKEGNGPIIRPHSRGNGQIVEDINLIALAKKGN